VGKRKISSLKVAEPELIYDDALNIVGEAMKVVSLADLPKPKQPEIYRGTDKLIEEFKKTGKVDNRALLREIAIAKLYHLDFGEGPYAAFPFELFDVIASVIADEPAWVREQAEAKERAGTARHAQQDSRAEELYRDGRARNRKEAAHLIAVEELEREKAAGKHNLSTVEAKAAWIARHIPRPPK
jgi:hypothetical protein